MRLCSFEQARSFLFEMSRESPSKLALLHSIENNRTNPSSKGKNATETIAVNTDPAHDNRNVQTNTPNYAEEMAKALENGQTPADIVQMLMQSKARRAKCSFATCSSGCLDEPSEAYWKLVTERRQRAIEETTTENEQVDFIPYFSPSLGIFSYTISSMN